MTERFLSVLRVARDELRPAVELLDNGVLWSKTEAGRFIAVLQQAVDFINGVLWGGALGLPLLVPLLGGVGVFLTLRLRFFSLRRLPTAFQVLWRGRRADGGEGEIPPFHALMTALSATIGAGNIAGVATAIYLGGPGAVFWMWAIAVFGMATKYAEAVLAVRYRETDRRGSYVGGPMYYIRNGLGREWRWLAAAFALFGMVAAFGIGNMVQANTVADALRAQFQVPPAVSGAAAAILVGVVIIGGIWRIGEVAAKIVPVMALAYMLCAATIIALNIGQVPAALHLIVTDAFTGTAASGGFAGAGVWAALRYGAARGIFSNEAGLGSAPIAHAAARTDSPVKQGLIAMLGTFLDTLVVCTMTALVIVISGAWTSGVDGAPMSSLAFNTILSGSGDYVVTLGLVVFAFTTMLGWSYYGERCGAYLFGPRIAAPYRLLWVLAIYIGAGEELSLVWQFADAANGLMALPNLLALLLLSPVIARVTRDYMRERP